MFKVIEFKIINGHPFTALNGIEIDFVKADEIIPPKKEGDSIDDSDVEIENEHYTTMLIGKNGSGKSQILKCIIAIFNLIAASKRQDKFLNELEFSGYLKYQIGDNLFEFNYILRDKNPTCKLNGQGCNILELDVPNKLLVTCFNLNDKFPVFTEKSKLKNNMYEYLGLRAASNNAFISIYEKKIIDNVNIVVNQGNFDAINRLFEVLEFEPKVQFYFTAGKKLQLNKGKYSIHEIYNNKKHFIEYYKELIGSLKDYRVDKYKKIIDNPKLIDEIVHYLKNNEEFFSVKTKSKIEIRHNLDFTKKKLDSNLKILMLLKDLDLLDLTNIIFQKKDETVRFSDISSGEFNLFANLIGLIAKCDHNSLVIIDEPEVSLHPNWQIEYMSILRSMFVNFKGVHFIVSTHSHFLISDIFKDTSNIVILNRSEDMKRITKKYFDDSTYGWSTEEILYYVFGVRSSRNTMFQIEVEKLLALISNRSNDFKNIDNAIKKLEPYKLNEYDPLIKVLEIAKNYLNENNYVTN